MRKGFVLGALVLLLVAGCGRLEAPVQVGDEDLVAADLLLDDAALEAAGLGGAAVGLEAEAGPLSDWPGPARRLLKRFFEAHGDGVPADLPGCVEVTPGQDADGDGVVAGFKAVFDCERTLPSGNHYGFHGTLTFDDADDQDAQNQGYTLDFANFEARFDGAGRNGEAVSLVRTFDGVIEVTPTLNNDQLVQLVIRKNLDFSFTRSVGERSATRSTHVERESVYTPDDPIAPYAAGELNPSGRFDHQGPGGAVSVVLTTDRALHFNRACTVSPRFDDGIITLSRYRNGQLEQVKMLTFVDCGHFVVEVERR